MSSYTVDFSRANAVIGQLESISKQIDTTLTALEQDTEKNLAEWQSEARNTYRECKLRWDESAARLPQLLGNARLALSEILTNYGRADNRAAGTFGGR